MVTVVTQAALTVAVEVMVVTQGVLGTQAPLAALAQLETMATTAMDAAGEITETPVEQELTATPET